MNQKRCLFIFLCGLYVLLPFVLLYTSEHDRVFWRWSHTYTFVVVLYSGLVALVTGIFFFYEKLGRAFSIFLICLYCLSIPLMDFFLGFRNFNAHKKIIDHPVYHHQLRPGKHDLAITDSRFLDHPYVMHINSQGLRRKEDISFRKPAGNYRILALGDSFTEGEGVNDEETFCYLVEQKLNQNRENHVYYEVLNAGVDSYAPILEKIYLMTKGITFEPDFVVVFYDMSDLMQTQEYLKIAEFDKDGNLIRISPAQQTFKKKFDIFMRTRFYFLGILYNTFKNKIFKDDDDSKAMLNSANKELLQFSISADQSKWMTNWQQVYKDIQDMYQFCQKNHIGFAVVVYPWGHQVNNFEWDIGRRGFNIPSDYTAPPDVADTIIVELEKRGIATLNLFPVFRNYVDGERLYFHKDMHWTKEGHALAAQSIAAFLGNKIR